MCCGKGAPRKPVVRQLPNPPATSKKVPVPIKLNKVPTPRAPAGSYNPPGKYCEKCGWVNAVSKYADPVTGKIIETRSCTNRKCENHK